MRWKRRRMRKQRLASAKRWSIWDAWCGSDLLVESEMLRLVWAKRWLAAAELSRRQTKACRDMLIAMGGGGL